MRKIDILNEVLRKIKEQDDAVAAIVSEPTPDPMTDLDTPIVPISYDNNFFGQLKVGDIFTDMEDESIKYKVVSDPVADEETGLVTSLPCEVIEAPEGNAKGVAVGDPFDAITAMPGKSEIPPGDELPPDDELPPSDEPSGDASIEEPTEAKKGGKKFKMGKPTSAPNQPEKKKGKKGEGYSLKRRFPGIKETLATGIVQELREDGVVVRMGKWHKVFPTFGGAKVGDIVEIDGDKITKVVNSQDQPIFSKSKS